MNSRTAPSALAPASPVSVPSGVPASAPASARLVFRLLRQLRIGSLELHDPAGGCWHFGAAGPNEPRASLRLHDWAALSAALKSGDVGFGEAYIAGQWSSPDLPALLHLLALNREVVERALYGSFWGQLWHRLRHALNRNSRSGSRRNIHAHYDLGNPFYRLWLDDTLNYSSAWFQGQPDQNLAQAQAAKMNRALDECHLQAGQRVLEIGCGWGAVAECATRDRGLKLTGVTLSAEQLAWAQERLDRQGLGARAELRLQDYRDIPETGFDAVVSIEMFEAVGRAYWPTFFQAVHDKLKPGGRACIQTITIRDDLFPRYLRGTDFIQQYVFPGGLLPCPSAFRAAAAQAGLTVVAELDFGPDYAETLRRWRQAFLARLPEVSQLGYDARFTRLWDFYLAYCEAGFDSGCTSVAQFTLVRAGD